MSGWVTSNRLWFGKRTRIKEKALFPEPSLLTNKQRDLTAPRSRILEDARDDNVQACASRNRLLTTPSMSFVLPG
jgi:hypothetical protein